MRATTLADARKMGLLYSVTKVCDVVRSPALEIWKLQNALLAALTLPRLEGEEMDAFAHRVVEDMNEQSRKAKGFGSLLHLGIERYLAAGSLVDWTCREHLHLVRDWLKEHCEQVHASEIIVGDPALGVAGKLDLDCTLKQYGRCIVDFKTQRVKDGKPVFYDEWPLQLAAYRHGRQREFDLFRFTPTPMRIVSVVINSDPDKPEIYAHWWSDEIDYMALFRGLLDFLKYQTGYDPAQVKAQICHRPQVTNN